MARHVAERTEVLARLAEVFRERGYEGASLALIGQATGLGKGSLYHFFPGGKDEMLAAVLADIENWFEVRIFLPLCEDGASNSTFETMFQAVSDYFRSGRRVCLVGALALGDGHERFSTAIARYFARWIEVLAGALRRRGVAQSTALALSQETVAGIQGAIVLSRALGETELFEQAIARMRGKLLSAGADDIPGM